jgi:glycosyltransferase involved in cell wall biosynthesis
MIDVILPVLDERDAIPIVLASIPNGFNPIVVDNGSTDGSGDRARALGAHVVNEPVRGFGAACHAGLQAATTDVVCFMDCDASCDGRELPRIVAPVERGDADLTLGARQPVTRGAWPWHACLGDRLLTIALRYRSGVSLQDLGPMRAARRDALCTLGITDRRFGWPLEMVVRAARDGWRIEEVDVTYAPRVGRSKVTGTLQGTLRTARDMARVLR